VHNRGRMSQRGSTVDVWIGRVVGLVVGFGCCSELPEVIWAVPRGSVSAITWAVSALQTRFWNALAGACSIEAACLLPPTSSAVKRHPFTSRCQSSLAKLPTTCSTLWQGRHGSRRTVISSDTLAPRHPRFRHPSAHHLQRLSFCSFAALASTHRSRNDTEQEGKEQGQGRPCKEHAATRTLQPLPVPAMAGPRAYVCAPSQTPD
jgi:hypothetical protein